MIEKYSTDSAEAQAAIAASGPKSIWIHGSITYIATGEDYTPPLEPEQPQQPKEQ